MNLLEDERKRVLSALRNHAAQLDRLYTEVNPPMLYFKEEAKRVRRLHRRLEREWKDV